MVVTYLCGHKCSKYETQKNKADKGGISDMDKVYKKQILETKQKPLKPNNYIIL